MKGVENRAFLLFFFAFIVSYYRVHPPYPAGSEVVHSMGWMETAASGLFDKSIIMPSSHGSEYMLFNDSDLGNSGTR